jgi:hypothetical protein
MRDRVRDPELTVTRRPRVAPAPSEHAVHVLQRRLGNRAVQRMLRAGGVLARDGSPPPTRLGIEPVTELHGDTSAEAWATDVRGRERFLALYAELATLLHATAIEDVTGTRPSDINTALRPSGEELKPGLNFVARLSDRGQTGYLYDGRFDAKLPARRDGPLPTVAILLGPAAFDPRNKASTLGVLRHELEHASHNRLALAWLKRWRDDGRAAKQSFVGWLKKQNMSAADRALVRERVDGTRINTEALGNLEAFIAGFPLEAPDVSEGAHPVYDELEDAADYWLSCDAAVQQEISARLKALLARLKGERRRALGTALRRLKEHDKRLAAFVDPLIAAL